MRRHDETKAQKAKKKIPMSTSAIVEQAGLKATYCGISFAALDHYRKRTERLTEDLLLSGTETHVSSH